MLTLLKGGECYSPDYIGKKDILITDSKIYLISESINEDNLLGIKVLDCEGKLICPGFIDQHVHIIGGGGEGGPASMIPEIMLSEIITSGVTTLVGVLGADGITRTPARLLSKARALREEGITAYIYTGSYNLPSPTITTNVLSDITLINEVIGLGEIAISDHRSSHPTLQIMKEIASEVRMGGLIGGKAGVMHIHVGDGKEGIGLLFQLFEQSDYPIDMFVPTHLNRKKSLFEEAKKYLLKGGNIDLTAGETSASGYTIPDALEILNNGVSNLDRVTVSSDGNGSIPSVNGKYGVGKISFLLDDIRSCILQKNLDVSNVLKTVTSNVSKILKLYPQKGVIQPGSDADIIVLNKNDLKIDKVIARGQVMVNGGVAIKKGRYEK